MSSSREEEELGRWGMTRSVGQHEWEVRSVGGCTFRSSKVGLPKRHSTWLLLDYLCMF
jgi:hypothetical protein